MHDMLPATKLLSDGILKERGLGEPSNQKEKLQILKAAILQEFGQVIYNSTQNWLKQLLHRWGL